MRTTALLVTLCACRIGFDPGRGPDGGGSAGDGGVPGDGDPVDGEPGDVATITCPGSYVALPGAPATSRYRAVDNSTPWLAAEAACESDGDTHLAILDNAAELNAIIAALPGDNIWIGVTDRVTPDTWRTVTGGIASFLPWDAGEPDGDECVFIDSQTLLLVDQDCLSGRRYVCECDGVPADLTSY